MKVKIERSTVANGQVVEAGQVVDLPKAEAMLLIRMGKAVPMKAKAERAVRRKAAEKAAK